MKNQCSYVDSAGRRCEGESLHRLYFSHDHPFDFMDVCKEHMEEYSEYACFLDFESNEIKNRIC